MSERKKPYPFDVFEPKWQQIWDERKTFKTGNPGDEGFDASRPKCYVLDMFPYPSGAGLHVGHPEGYTATDIVARFKRMNGFNVLHPMGWDSFGLPAEQYAIKTGQHPAITTFRNIDNFRRQLKMLGFSYDWDREIATTDHEYVRWTQWIFLRLYNSYYNRELKKARPVSELEAQGLTREEIDQRRLAYVAEVAVNWSPDLGTVLANEEVEEWKAKGHHVERRPLRQWMLRITRYAQRLLDGLETINWTDSLKETQRNWIGRSEGTEVEFSVKDSDVRFTIFTTRADTMFGVTFMVLAPESPLVETLTTADHEAEVKAYLEATKKRTERERIMDRKVTGVFSGSYAINPFTGEAIPVWISDYVLAGYGTGAIMAVPAHDSRDYAFARHFNLPVIPLIEGCDVSESSYDAKEGTVCNSPRPDVKPYIDFSLNGLSVKEAIAATKKYVAEHKLGRVKVNYRLRDAIFSRQRYWGEPFPVYYKDGMPQMVPSECLPLELPEIEKFEPTETGEPPLGHARKWAWDTAHNCVVENSLIDQQTVFPLELNTMPGFAGSSAYYLRYMDPHNDKALISKEADEYWREVDLYVGGTEHATGHLIYSRFWNKFLHDYGYSCVEEPFKKLVNQGMIQGRSNFVYRIKDTETYVSCGLKDQYDVTPIHVDVNIVQNDVLDIEAFKQWRPEYKDAEFILEDGKYICGWAVEKMSKSMYNVVNPDLIVEKYGADTLRLYEMFLGPINQSKPWDSNGIDGCSRFLRKLWNLYWHNDELTVTDDKPSEASLKTLHKLIKKVTSDIEEFSYNTSISAFMIAVSELAQQKCHSREVLQTLSVLIAPFTPHIAEELWNLTGGQGSVCDAAWPQANEEYLKENNVTLSISFNGKTRFTMDFPVDMPVADIQKAALEAEASQKYLAGMTVVKVIVVPGRIVNIVLKK